MLKGDSIRLLRQNYVNEQMLKTHEHSIIGYITATVRLDPGLVSSFVACSHLIFGSTQEERRP